MVWLKFLTYPYQIWKLSEEKDEKIYHNMLRKTNIWEDLIVWPTKSSMLQSIIDFPKMSGWNIKWWNFKKVEISHY